MQGRRRTGWLRVMPAFLLVFGLLAGGAPGAAHAQDPAAQIEVTEVRQADGNLLVTVMAPASLVGAPKVSIDGAAGKADVSVARQPAVVLAVETSSSMGSGLITPVYDAAVAFLRQLPPTTKVAVVTFDSAVKTSGFGDVAAAQAVLAAMVPSGGSALFDAVNSAATSLRDDPAHTSASVVLVTHGWDWGGASVSNRADSFGAAQALGAQLFPVILGNDFDRALLTNFANPARTAPWTLDDLAGGTLAAAVASGARVEHRLQVATGGLKGGDHELAVGWDGPTAVTPVVRTFPVSGPATKAGLAATAEGVASALNLNNGESDGNSLVPVATVVMLALLVAAYWTIRRSRTAAVSKVGGRLEQLEETPTVPEPASIEAPVFAVAAPVSVNHVALPAEGQADGPVIGPIVARTAAKPDAADQRAFERVQLGVGAELSLSGVGDASPMSVLAYDISEGGLSFRSHSEIPAGATGYLSMELPPNGEEVQLHVLILNVVLLDGGEMYSAHCSFIDITPRTLWRIVGACLALSGDKTNADELMNWGVRHVVSAELPEGDALFEPKVVAGTTPTQDVVEEDPFALVGEPFGGVEDSSFVDEFAASVVSEVAVGAAPDTDVPEAPEVDVFDYEVAEDIEPAAVMAGEPFGEDAFSFGATAAVTPSVDVEEEFVAAVADEAREVFERDEVGAGEFELFGSEEPVVIAEESAVDGDERDAGDWVDAVASTAVVEDDVVVDGAAVEVPVAATTGDDRAMSAAMQLAWLLGDASDAKVSLAAAPVDSMEEAEPVAPTAQVEAAVDEVPVPALVAVRSSEMQETRFEAPATPDEVQCSHCAGGVLELQRLVRQDDFLESWWLCMACTRITYRQQAPEAWLRTTSVPDSGDAPGPVGPSTDFATVLLRMRQEEAAATARAAELREELARAESVLRDIRTLHRLLDRFGTEGEPRAEGFPSPRNAGESPAA